MSFLIGLFSPVFTQRMGPFNSLFLALAATQPVLMGVSLDIDNYCTSKDCTPALYVVCRKFYQVQKCKRHSLPQNRYGKLLAAEF